MDPVGIAKGLDNDFRRCCAELDQDEPWFGSFALRVDGDIKQYRVGRQKVPELRIVHWRMPLAKAYYECQPGDLFQLEEPFRPISGELDRRSAITSRARSVRRVDISHREGEIAVVATDAGFEVLTDGSRSKEPQTGLPNILALLTLEQYQVIASSRTNPVILQGRAGSGKTTVALYRVAYLAYPEEESQEAPIDPARVLIVMFNKALATFVKESLEPLNLQAARLDTFHGWALSQIRRAYRGEIKPDPSQRAGADTATALKKQLGVLSAIDAFVTRQTDRLDGWLEAKLGPYQATDWLERFQTDKTPVVRRLIKLRAEVKVARDEADGAARKRLEQVHRIFTQGIKRMTQYKEELLKLLTDQELLAKHLPGASSAELDTLAAYQRELQGQGGTERRPGPGIAFDDFALVLRFIQLKNGGYPDKDREDEVEIFDHLVVDEAQDFGAVELTVLLSSVRSRTGVTIVGDVNQKILPDVAFMGWQSLADELGIEGAKVQRLEVAHRSAEPVMRVADTLVGDTTAPGRPGPRPTLTIEETDEAKLARAAELIRAALAENPSAHVCVVCRHAGKLAETHKLLEYVLAEPDVPVRIGYRDNFAFEPGVTVTNMRQVKGLEFDAVIVLDPTEEAYPDDTEGRRYLYMVLTRAKDRVDLVSAKPPTALLRPAIDQGLLEVIDETAVVPVEFTEEDDEPF